VYSEITFKRSQKDLLARHPANRGRTDRSGAVGDSAWKVIGLYRMRADWTIRRVAGIKPGARSSPLHIKWAPLGVKRPNRRSASPDSREVGFGDPTSVCGSQAYSGAVMVVLAIRDSRMVEMVEIVDSCLLSL
jgi:hypothetical protein